ncbi:MAG: hypothetical protein J6Y17_03420 [Elusimicrobiaceae bacterium]|nr:hypothetical protein [Elusimicrobiaceae bacterium]
MKHLWLFIFFLGTTVYGAQQKTYKPQTKRAQAQYLSIDALKVTDTCPGADIINSFTCTKSQPAGFTCFDVYRVQGDPMDKDRYTLLDQALTTEDTTAEPKCNFDGELTCDNFLQTLKYNLDFSWFITNFPSSSFPECGKTYTCTRIACWKTLQDTSYGAPQAKKLSCVFKKNQIYFLGSQITCEDKNAPSKK